VNARLFALVTAFFAILGMVQALPADARARDGSVTSLHDVFIGSDRVVDGDVNVVFGDATIAGVVKGDCNAPFGHCVILDNGRVDGHVYSGADEGARAFLPWAFGSGVGVLAGQDHRLLVKLAASAVVVLMFLLFPLRMRVALDRVEKHPALSALTGFIAVLAVFPIAILLFVSIIGIPLVFLEIFALIVGIWIGTGAVALLVGRRLCELVVPASTPSPFLALVLGLIVVSAAEIVPLVGWFVSVLVWLVGLGAAILSFIRSVSLDSAVRRAPIGGPPMRNLR
jgi:hypothetical protein